MARFFLDTNVLLYAYDQIAKEKEARAWKLIRHGVASQDGVISYQVVQEFINVALKKFQPHLPANEIRAAMSSYLRPMLAVESSPMLTLDALDIHERYQFSWYDSLIVAAAKYAECEILYSEDLQAGFQLGKLRVVNPFAS